MKPRILRLAAFAALLAASLLGLQGMPSTSAAAAKPLKVSAHFIYEDKTVKGGCTWGIGVVVSPVAGATSYTISYYDRYYGMLEGGVFTPAQLARQGGELYLGVTGGGYSTPCQGGDATEGGRFGRGATAYANFPPNHKPKPSLKVDVSVPAGGIVAGGSVPVTVTVSAGEVAMNAISLGRGLDVGGGLAEVTSKPGKLSGFSLAAGGSRSFSFTVKAVAPGAARLSAKASGSSKRGPASGSGSATLRIAKAELALTMATTPAKVLLNVTNDGKVEPADVIVTVSLTNTSTAELNNVSLQSVNPVPVVRSQPLDQIALDPGSLPLDIGMIPARTTVSRQFHMTVTGDGAYELQGLALYSTDGRVTAVGGRFQAVVPLLFFTGSLDGAGAGGQLTVAGGMPWYVSGHVKNLSSFQTVCLSPLGPRWDGNAGGLGPHAIGIQPGDPAPPLAGPVKPGETISWLLRADTQANGGTRSAVTLEPRVTRGDPGDACNVLSTDKRPALPASELKIPAGSDSFFAHVDNSHAGSEAGAGFLEFFGAYGEASYKVLAKALEQGISFVKEYGGVPKLYAALRSVDPAHAAQRAATALATAARTTALAASFWIDATEEEKYQFLTSVYENFAAKTGKVWDGTKSAIQQSAQGWFEGIVRAYYSGDDSAMFKALGSASGTVLTQGAIDMAKFELGLTLLKKSAQLSRIAARVALRGRTLTALRGITVGRILQFEEMQRLWGLSRADFEAFQRIAQEEGIVIGVRGRSAASVKNLEEGAVWKHENLKPKNVNDIDTQFLGFPEGDTGLVAFRTYTEAEKAAILNKIHTSGLTPEQIKAAVERATIRFDEHQYLPQIERYAHQGKIDVGFNYRENGLDVESSHQSRKFALESSSLEGGGTYYRPVQENAALDHLAKSGGKLPAWCRRLLEAVLCRVTGDMDGVYLCNVGGTSLSAEQRLRVYLKLAEAGWQHPETLTWLKDTGEFFFSAKKKILSGLQLAGEAMMEFGPDGKVRATYLDLAKSFLFGVDNYYIDILGGYGALK